MFCPACGVEYSQKLNYCKNCGVELGPPAPVEVGRVARPKFGWMFLAIALLAIAGTGLNFIAYYNLAAMGLHGGSLMVPFMLGLGTISLVALLLVRQLSRLISYYREASLASRYQQPAIQPAATLPSRLGAPKDVASSVVEHTTRQFAPVYREPPES
jgi:hypothetical protein